MTRSLVLFTVLFLAGRDTLDAWAPGDSAPNIIYILADDLGGLDMNSFEVYKFYSSF